MKKLLLSTAIILSATAGFAQNKVVNKAFNEVKAASPNFGEAQTLIKQALANPETENQAKTWYVAGFIEYKIFENERNQQVLNKTPNQDKMYESLLNTYNYYLKAAELDNLPDEKGRVKPKYTKEIITTLRNNQNFFINGGSYYYDKKDYPKSYQYFDIFTQYNNQPLFAEENIPQDSLYLQIVFYKGVTASLMEDHQKAVDTYESLKGKNYQENDIYKYLSTEYLNMKDSANFEKTLEEGAKKFPSEPFYIQTLINIYLNNAQYDKALVYLDGAISQEPENAQFYDIKGRLLENQKDLDKALEFYKIAVEKDPFFADAYANIGRIYYNYAVEEQDKTSLIKDNRAYNKALEEQVRPKFMEALPFYEKAHELKPDEREYMLALRGIYYNLRMGDKYEAMEAKINAQ